MLLRVAVWSYEPDERAREQVFGFDSQPNSSLESFLLSFDRIMHKHSAATLLSTVLGFEC